MEGSSRSQYGLQTAITEKEQTLRKQRPERVLALIPLGLDGNLPSSAQLRGTGEGRNIIAVLITELQPQIQAQANISMTSSEDLKRVLTRARTQIHEFANSNRFGKLFRIVAAESFRDPVSLQKFDLLGPGMGRENTAALSNAT